MTTLVTVCQGFTVEQATIEERAKARDVGGLHCRRHEHGGGGSDRKRKFRKKLCLEGLLSNRRLSSRLHLQGHPVK